MFIFFVAVTLVGPMVSSSIILPFENVGLNWTTFNLEDESAGRVVGGLQAKEGQFPYQLSLRWRGSHFCGAVLVQAPFIPELTLALTAGHCLEGISKELLQNSSPLTVMGGSISLVNATERRQIIEVSKFKIHEEYSFPHHDIALMVLKESFRPNREIQPVSLPSEGEEYTGDVFISGWGKIEESSSSLSENLRYTEVPIVQNDECAEIYGTEKITGFQMCAGRNEGGRDTCQGDSGGPCANSDHTVLYGITSWGRGCARPGYPGVYTRVSAYIPWIQKTSQEQQE